MNQLHSISPFLVIHIASVVSTSHTQWAGEMPVQGDYYSEFAPNQVTVPLRDNKSSLESSDSLRKESPSDIAIDKNQF